MSLESVKKSRTAKYNDNKTSELCLIIAFLIEIYVDFDMEQKGWGVIHLKEV